MLTPVVSRQVLLPVLFFGVALVAAPQVQETNPAHTPSVFLGGPKNKKEKAPTSRSLTGKVVDDSGQPLQGALVSLLDTKTNEKRTFITKKDGRYNFDDLSFTIDYELQARYKDSTSDAKKLSQYDHRAELVRILEIEPTSKPAAEDKKEPAEPKRQ